jgi:hypothetical protein
MKLASPRPLTQLTLQKLEELMPNIVKQPPRLSSRPTTSGSTLPPIQVLLTYSTPCTSRDHAHQPMRTSLKWTTSTVKERRATISVTSPATRPAPPTSSLRWTWRRNSFSKMALNAAASPGWTLVTLTRILLCGYRLMRRTWLELSAQLLEAVTTWVNSLKSISTLMLPLIRPLSSQKTFRPNGT